MLKEDMNSKQELILTDAPQKLILARELAKNIPCELYDLCDYLAQIADEELTPIKMIWLLVCSLNQIQSLDDNSDIPKTLKDKKEQIISAFKYFPCIIDKIAGEEFSSQFNKIFNDIFCS